MLEQTELEKEALSLRGGHSAGHSRSRSLEGQKVLLLGLRQGLGGFFHNAPMKSAPRLRGSPPENSKTIERRAGFNHRPARYTFSGSWKKTTRTGCLDTVLHLHGVFALNFPITKKHSKQGAYFE